MVASGSRLAPRGWYLLGAIGTMVLFAAVVGVEELYALALSAAALVATCVLWLSRQQARLVVTSTVTPRRSAVGSDASAQIGVANLGRRRSPLLSVTVPLDKMNDPGANAPLPERASLYVASFSLPPLAAGGRAGSNYKLPTTERGAWALGQVTARLSDPLGLTEKSWCGGRDAYFCVHPRVVPLPWPPGPEGRERPGQNPARYLAHGGDELHSLRAYQEGDDLRHIHWRSTARWDELIVRQDEPPHLLAVSVHVDLRASAHSQSTLEPCLEAAASVVTALLSDADVTLRFTTTRGEVMTGSGEPTRFAILDRLALLNPHDAAPMRTPGSAQRTFKGAAEIAFLISPTEQAARQLGPVSTSASFWAVVLTSEHASRELPSREREAGGRRAVVIRAGDGLLAAWAAPGAWTNWTAVGARLKSGARAAPRSGATAARVPGTASPAGWETS
jgi:uncharacterized protein (DUF58 family)